MQKGKQKIVEKPIEQGFAVLTSADVARGAYSNVAVVQHSSDEFIIDFLFKIRNDAHLVSRVVLSPKHMRSFRDTITENLEKYEKTHGGGKNSR